MLLIFMLLNFNPLIKLLLFVPQGEDISFFSIVRGTNLFSVSKFTCSPKKESEKLKNSHFEQIHVQFASRKLLRIKVTLDLHLTYSKNGGNLGLVLKIKKYSLYLNFIDKPCKIYLFIFV